MTEEGKRTKAWIGDAVLALFAREWILKQKDISTKERAEVFIQITSNQFLASLGEPTTMEAEIGGVYETDGLHAAFDFIEQKILPLFSGQRIAVAVAIDRPAQERARVRDERIALLADSAGAALQKLL